MGYYKGATICLNGHVVDKYSANSQLFCSKCGKETYSKCLSCGAPIRGKYIQEGVIDLSGYYKKPYYCYQCGKAYPWTNLILENAIELISLDDEIDEASRKLIKEAIPDLIVDTPLTPIAVAKYKKGLAKAGKIVKDALYNMLIDVISETAKKSLFG